MQLSNKKIKQIRRLSPNYSRDEIADQLMIPVAAVNQVLNNNDTQKSSVALNQNTALVFDWVFLLLKLAFICVAPFFIINGIYDFANLPQSIFIRIGSLILIIVWLIKESFNPQSKLHLLPIHIPLIIFFIWSAITLNWAANVFEGVVTWLMWIGPFMAFLLFFHSMKSKQECMFILYAVYISGIAVALLGIGQFLFGVKIVPQVAIPSATFANKNMAAHYMVLTIPLGLGFFLSSKKNWTNWFFGLTTALLVVFLFYTRARAGWLAFFVELGVFASMLLWNRQTIANRIVFDKHKIMAIIAAFMLTVVMIHFNSKGFSWYLAKECHRIVRDASKLFSIQKADDSLKIDVTEDEKDKDKAEAPDTKDLLEAAKNKQTGKESSFAGRFAIFRNSWEMIKDYFICGVGLGNHKVYYPLYFRKVVVERWFSEQFQLTNAHNDYIQTWSETGSIGMFFLLVGAMGTVFMIKRILDYETENRFLIIGIAVCMAGLLMNAFFSFPFQRALPPLLLMIYLSAIGYFYINYTKPSYVQFSPVFALILAFFVVLVASQLYGLEKKWLQCDRYYLRITSAEKAKMWHGVIREANHAIALNPHRRKILSYMGRAYIESGNSEKGIEALKKVIEVYPYHMNAMLNLGVAYGNVKDYDSALNTYQRVIDIKPDYAKVHNNVANIYMKQQKLDKALQSFRLAATFDPTNPVIHFNVGIVALNKKLYEEARDAFTKAIQIRPKWAMAHKNLGVVLYQYLKKQEEGVVHFQQALKYDPDIKDHQQMKLIISKVLQAAKIKKAQAQAKAKAKKN
ncbi:MAG: O-antigen polymerase [Candidatus Magnetoglobus multicellularis str. Araruama]|uniref:O-antigen polymerase n=1 Tax=Candidatus Magnetoglobus multicellularis str. Araruama TaxID=890399 RepID=A0A1V1PBT2_9BACT|nr:MAG: O-antigen polymerase [Candidatus Magnetoglobus multicellularis str. Araruama]